MVGIMSDAQWYYAEDGEQKGPVALAEIQRLVSAKRIQAEDLVWREGMEDWLPLGEVAELRPAKPKQARKLGPAEAKPAKESAKPADAAPQPSLKSQATANKTPAKSAKTVATAPTAAADLFAFADAEVEKVDSTPDFDEGAADEEPAAEESSDEIDAAAEALFARPKFPAKRPRPPASFQREPEIIRETTREVIVTSNADAQLSAGALFTQLICWVLCGMAICGAAVMCALRWFSAAGVESFSAMLASVAIGSYILARSAQRCLEILAAIKNL